MRLFIAINIAAPVRNALDVAVVPLQRLAPEAKWVSPELLHLTVKFLGEQTPDFAEQLGDRLDSIAANYAPMDLSIGGMGAFPNLRRPAVVWIGVHGDAKLELLQSDIESACLSMGVPVDGRPFRPHVTLARLRAPASGGAQAFAAATDRISFEESTRAESVDLMLSEQRGSRIHYSVVHSATFGRV